MGALVLPLDFPSQSHQPSAAPMSRAVIWTKLRGSKERFSAEAWKKGNLSTLKNSADLKKVVRWEATKNTYRNILRIISVYIYDERFSSEQIFYQQKIALL